MISIFEDRAYQAESGATRDAYMQRLQEIAGQDQFALPGSNGTETGALIPVVESTDPPLLVAVTNTRVEEAPVSPPPGACSDNGNPLADEIQRLTERIAPMLVEALAGAMRELHQYTAGDRRRMDASLSAVNDISQQLRSVAAELSLLRQQMERIEGRLNAQEADQRSVKEDLQKLAAAPQQFTERASKIEDGQKSLDRRLEIQAGAIRALHVTASDRGDRREEFRATLRRLEEILGALSPPRQLPDGL